jgi:DNA repair exonuclease SbcCD ATPase subunit
VQAQLAAGNACAAASHARALEQAVEVAIADGRVPVELRSELRRATRSLAATVECDVGQALDQPAEDDRMARADSAVEPVEPEPVETARIETDPVERCSQLEEQLERIEEQQEELKERKHEVAQEREDEKEERTREREEIADEKRALEEQEGAIEEELRDCESDARDDAE